MTRNSWSCPQVPMGRLMDDLAGELGCLRLAHLHTFSDRETASVIRDTATHISDKITPITLAGGSRCRFAITHAASSPR